MLLNIIKFYLKLIKVPQNALLLFTFLAGYLSASGSLEVYEVIIATLGIFFVISGTTSLNMFFDRDIDAIAQRTKERPLPTGKISPLSALMFSIILVALGSALNFMISMIYSLIVLAGLFFDIIVYTLWTKRRSPFSILFGGIAGGIPILAGRFLAIGKIDIIGIVLLAIVLLWIPSHILTLVMNYAKDYKLIGIPTFANVFGFQKTRYFIAFSNILCAGLVIYIMVLMDLETGFYISLVGSGLLLLFSLISILKPSDKINKFMFKYASVYMVCIMLILIK